MNDHGLEQMVHFPTRKKNTLDLILTTLPGQFQDVHSPDKLSDHDIVSGTLKISPKQCKTGNWKYLQKVVMHECFGATIVLGTPLTSSLLYIIKLFALLLRLA